MPGKKRSHLKIFSSKKKQNFRVDKNMVIFKKFSKKINDTIK